MSTERHDRPATNQKTQGASTEDLRDFATVVTRLKKQLTDAGWTEQGAERAVYAVILKSGDPK